MSREVRPVLLFLLILLGGGRNVAEAQTIDPHQLYEEKCARCHAPHAGDFVHESLILSGENVLGRKSNQDVRGFLDAGHGGLTPVEINTMATFLTQISLSGQLFHNKCLICHDRAVRLARLELRIKEGRLVGRYSGRDIERFLNDHGRLKADEISKIVSVLKRQLETAGN